MKVSEAKQTFEYKEHKTLSALKLVTLSNEGVSLYSMKTNTFDKMETL